MTAYYNEFDPHAAQWLRNLILRGLIAPGEVDERSILDVRPDDLAGFTQCHFFAGIGVWSHALRRAGVPDAARIWTGSCPCQPFSAAGKRGGLDDERHLWPAWFHLIDVCRPKRIFGEQVASKDGLAWLDLVHADLEGAGYAVGAADLCAAGFGAPHIRQRLFFMADATGGGCTPWVGYDDEAWHKLHDERGSKVGHMADPELLGRDARITRDGRRQIGARGEHREVDDRRRILGVLVDPEGQRLFGRPDDSDGGRGQRASGQGCEAGGLADTDGRVASDGELQRSEEQRFEPGNRSTVVVADAPSGGCGMLGSAALPRCGGYADSSDAIDLPSPTNGFWRDADWLGCTDGKWRPVESGTFPLVDGLAFRVGSCCADLEGKSRAKMLKGYGNAIVSDVAAEFIFAAFERGGAK